MRVYLTLLAVLMCALVHAQTPGAVRHTATLPSPLDPNGDGWITSTGAAFSGPLDETEFELPFVPIPEYEPEPVPDNQVPSTSCTMYELVGDAAKGAESTYYYYQDPDGIAGTGDERIFFRFRVARMTNSSVALSILIDTDHKFGFSNPDPDPNAVVGNPGFELEISINYTGGTNILIYDVDGVSNPSVVKASYPATTYLQAAYALNQDSDCSTRIPGFVDIYLPFSALGISSTAQVRMVGASAELTGSVLGGKASDISGVDGNVITGDDNQFIAAMGSFPSFSFQGENNNPPSATDATVSLNENSANGTAVHTVSATDPDGSALTYSITGGNTSTAFAINGSTGAITVNNSGALNFEITPSFSLTVTVSDGSLSDNAIITINLNDVNEIPSAADATVPLNENSANGTEVHTVSATDPDGDALNYAITAGNTSATFAINSSGSITVNNAAALDYENTPSYTLTITVSDGSLFDAAFITVNLIKGNEAPSVLDAAVSLNENSANGTVVHTVSASDPDGDALTYAITEGNGNNVFVISDNGVLTVNDFSKLDFEVTPAFLITVQVSDGEQFAEALVTINLQNINERPTLGDAVITIPQSLSTGTVIYNFVAEDPDADDTAVFSIEDGNSDSAFIINENTGDIIINDTEQFDQFVNPAFTLTIAVRDAGGLSATASLTINLENAGETASIDPLKGFSPNGDGINDYWLIKGIESFPDNEVKVFNRWGNLVFETKNYNNENIAWRGFPNNKGDTTYFFLITVEGLQPITGYVVLKE